jgi:hypothetical protein
MIQSKKALAGTASRGRDSAVAIGLANGWLEHGTELGLGTNNLDDIDLVEIDLA